MVGAVSEAAVELDLDSASAALRAYGTALEGSFLERKDEVRGLLIAVLAKCNILLLGPPGSAKSELTVAFSDGLGWESFATLIGKTTTPEEIFGPLSVRGLRDDKYLRCTAGFLPSARIGFADEVFKGSSAILNTLLTIMNEKKINQNGVRVDVPLEVLVGASNELPQDDGLQALYDRFLLRYWTRYLQDNNNFRKLLTMTRGEGPRLDPAVVDFLRAMMPLVDLEPVLDKVVSLRDELSGQHGIVRSDRRWKQCMGLIAASALLDGRTVTQGRDMAILVQALWDKPEEIDPVRATLAKVRSPGLFRVNELIEITKGLVEKLPRPESVTLDQAAELGKTLDAISKILEETKQLDKTDPEIADGIAEIRRMGRGVKQLVDKAMGRVQM